MNDNQKIKLQTLNNHSGGILLVFKIILLMILLTIIVIVAIFAYYTRKDSQNDIILKFVHEYTLINSATHAIYQMSMYRSENLLSSSPAQIYSRYIDIEEDKGIGFITKENVAYAFKKINDNCTTAPAKLTEANVENACAKVLIDINNSEKPNKFSSKKKILDRYTLFVFKDGVVPMYSSIEDELIKSYGNQFISMSETGNNINPFERKFKDSYIELDALLKMLTKEQGKQLGDYINDKVALFAFLNKHIKIKKINSNGILTNKNILYGISVLNKTCPDIPEQVRGNDACARITIDVNGSEGPNTFTGSGKASDSFILYAYNNGITVETGSQEEKILWGEN